MFLQETKLTSKDTFRIHGYHVIRRDRTRGRRAETTFGGGEATLIREGTPFTVLDSRCTAPEDETTDALQVELQCPLRIKTLNVYVPPIRASSMSDTPTQHFTPDQWPHDTNAMIFGDVNGHSAAWDPLVEEDAIGEQVQEWISQRDFVVANSGAPTRQSPAPPYALSTPDITLHHSTLTNRVEWETLTALPSDHFPILVKVRVGKRKKEEKRKTKPSFKKADWALFEKIIEEKLAASPERDPVPWWTEEVDEAVRRRDELRAQAKADPAAGAAWREAAKEASLTITKARQESRRTFASGLSLRSDVGQVWSTIRAIDGRSATTRRDDATLRVGNRRTSKDSEKADAFMRVYSAVSHLPPRVREDRRVTHELTDFLRTPCTQCGHSRRGCCSPFSEAEMTEELSRLPARKAAGLDRIANEMLGAVTSPALFNLFINDITDDFPPGVSASLYADDLAIWCSDRDVSAAETKVQRALDSLEEWARRWKMVVSLEKTTSTIFTLDPAEARREAALHFQGQPVKFSPTTTFLGITLDRSLTFTGHVKTIKAKMLQRNNVLRAISGTTWGCSPSDLRSTYLAFSRACADYAAGAWMPGLSESGLRELETVQRQACRTITGCVRSTPVDALAREADLLPFSARRRQLAAVAMERHSRDLPGDPVQRILLPENRPRQRLRYDRGWARTGQEISKDAGLDDFPREPFLVVASTPPWESPPPPTVLFHTGLVRPLPQNAPAEQRRTAAEETLAGLPNPDVQAFTDGSATAGTERGGAGAVVYRSGREVKRIRAPAGRFTSSYTAELLALRETLKYIESILTDQDPALNIQLCTDSLSSLMRLREGPANQTERVADQVWLSLRRLGRRHRVDLQWVPGHAGVAGNEIADAVAREAAELPQDGTPITFAAAKSLLKRHVSREWVESTRHSRPAPATRPHLSHDYHDVVGPGRVRLADRLGLSRREGTALARLRTGHSPALQAYRHFIGAEEDDGCPTCDGGVREDAEHFLTSCPATARVRHDVFGREDPTLREVFADPCRVIEFLRRLGRL
ncbi:RNA-directed DNA polymerase from mobile element jockey [Amphibalanus amphitrite]|uniref:RNA-directed DNA polymerase from mobile element jockey n=1 Tax=Amphibalanus amphitrite TaxID=1232801 RepID=A0A6A4X368_AMPAM|nr:RNA-directed DNA polymerase from mobile element jockey [Amphibalanus amphitrite]